MSCIYNEKPLGMHFCPTCERGYEIIEVDHVCPPISRCGPKGKSYREEYTDYVRPVTTTDDAPAIDKPEYTAREIFDKLKALQPNDDGIKRAECDQCERMRDARTVARHGICPGCSYIGHYISDECGRCPSCVAQTRQSVQEKKVSPSRAMPAPTRRNLYLHYRTESSGRYPKGECSMLYIHAICEADENGPEVVFEEEICMRVRSADDDYVEKYWADRQALSTYIDRHARDPETAMRDLVKMIAQWCEKYALIWMPENWHDERWLRQLSKKYNVKLVPN